jgi:hypothetical protein
LKIRIAQQPRSIAQFKRQALNLYCGFRCLSHPNWRSFAVGPQGSGHSRRQRGEAIRAEKSRFSPRKSGFSLMIRNGGAEEIRTPDPHNAIVVLYQLSYDPNSESGAND